MPLDDDDAFATSTAVARLEQVALSVVRPAFIIFKVDHGPGIGVLPKKFGVLPEQDGIGGTVCVRADVWHRTKYAWDSSYGGDYSFVRALFSLYQPAWIDEVLVKCLRVSRGQS